ncbi:MAG TPA: hypothetical protein VF867_01315 [Arthrobacter sp.]
MTYKPAHESAGQPNGGQFAKRTALEPGIVLVGHNGDRAVYVNDSHLYQRELEALIGDAEIEDITPATKAETKKLLKDAKGAPDGKVRLIRINATNYPETKTGEKLEVRGAKDGRPVIVDILSGMPRLKVTSGTAVIRPRSGWGNSVDVGAEGEAVMIAPSSSKVTTECEEGGKVTFVCPNSKNRFRPFGKGEILLSSGTDTDRIPYVAPVYESF